MLASMTKRITAKLLSGEASRTTAELLFNKDVYHPYFQILRFRYRVFSR